MEWLSPLPFPDDIQASPALGGDVCGGEIAPVRAPMPFEVRDK